MPSAAMYHVDGPDKVIRLMGVPAPWAGAPEPVVVAEEGRAVVAFYAAEQSNGDTARSEELGDARSS
jgi:hypothetical protein